MHRNSQVLIRSMTVVASLAFAACASVPAVPAPSFVLTSSDFSAGGNLPDSVVLNGLDCHGPNISPALQWAGAPAATKGFALVLDDYEARGGDGFVHWAVYNIPASATAIPSNAGAVEGDMASGGRQAYNDFLKRSTEGRVRRKELRTSTASPSMRSTWNRSTTPALQ